MANELSERDSLPGPYAGEGWEDLIASADEITGGDLEKGAMLVGVPFVITGLTFRQGDFLNAAIGGAGWYVSADVVIGPEAEIKRAERRGRIPEENRAAVDPGERLVFNEGGTGVYRQLVSYLSAKGYIRINSDLPEEGPYGKCKWDVLPPEWNIREDIQADTLRIAEDGTRILRFSIRLLCPRGLRQSEYENEYTKQGVTRYLG